MSSLLAPDDAAAELRQLALAAAPAVRARPDLARVVLTISRRERRSQRRRKVMVGIGGLLVLATMAATNLLGRSDYFTVTQPSGAMEPTVQMGERVVFSKGLAPTRADVVLVHLIRDGQDYQAMMRIVALAGETVGCPAGPAGHCEALVVGGAPVPEHYLDTTVMEPFPTTLVPAETVFLLGDNRSVARDSRWIGPVRVADIVGVAVQIRAVDGKTRAVPGAPAHRGPSSRDNVDPASPVPPPEVSVPQ
ncbi:MAG TPA: signal peptidase I [Micromonosporaceae bacterium]|nr:signal peptidase I [Micromonosporaceae bacterium]